MKDEVAEIFGCSKNLSKFLHDEIVGQRDIEAYEKLRWEKSSTDGKIRVLMGYARSPFQDFESFSRITVDLGEKDIQLKFEHYTFLFLFQLKIF